MMCFHSLQVPIIVCILVVCNYFEESDSIFQKCNNWYFILLIAKCI